MNRNTVWIVIIAAVVVLAIVWFLSSRTPVVSLRTPIATPVIETPEVTAPASGVTVTYTDQGFSPKSVTVPAGTTITFVNQTGENMWVASALHPTHQTYDGTTMSEHCTAGYRGPAPFDQCVSGDSFSFIFLKVGEWKYHNHADATDFGTIIVTGNAAAPSSL